MNIVQKAFDPPPFYLNICPILQGVFSLEEKVADVAKTKILELMYEKDIWINVQVYYDQVLGPECSCSLSGCEFDYQTNTYRLQVSAHLGLMSWQIFRSNFFHI